MGQCFLSQNDVFLIFSQYHLELKIFIDPLPISSEMYIEDLIIIIYLYIYTDDIWWIKLALSKFPASDPDSGWYRQIMYLWQGNKFHQTLDLDRSMAVPSHILNCLHHILIKSWVRVKYMQSSFYRVVPNWYTLEVDRAQSEGLVTDQHLNLIFHQNNHVSHLWW